MENELYDAVNSVIRYNSKYSELTRSLIKSFPEIKSRENVVFSPLSIIMLLGIVYSILSGAKVSSVTTKAAPAFQTPSIARIIEALLGKFICTKSSYLYFCFSGKHRLFLIFHRILLM